MTTDQLQQVGCVQQKQDRSEDRPLRHPERHSRRRRAGRRYAHMLELTAQLGCKPVDYGSVKSIGSLQPSEEHAVVNAIRGCGQVEEQQHRENV